jgi:flagellar assembly protein FliH
MSTETGFSSFTYPSLQPRQHEHEELEAWAAGHAAGFAVGLRDAAKQAAVERARLEAEYLAARLEAEARADRAVAVLSAAAGALSARTLPVLEDIEESLAQAALELAETILGYELDTGENRVRSVIARALNPQTPQSVHTVRMNPDDLAMLDPGAQAESDVAFVADPSLAPGDAVGEYPDGFLDARLSAALARVRSVLSGGPA